jgi:DNA polymerase-3 subunit alpha
VIRFGLAAVKGVGTKAVEAVIKNREEKGSFANIYEFAERVDLRAMNRATIEALIKAGAFDLLGGNRAQHWRFSIARWRWVNRRNKTFEPVK